MVNIGVAKLAFRSVYLGVLVVERLAMEPLHEVVQPMVSGANDETQNIAISTLRARITHPL